MCLREGNAHGELRAALQQIRVLKTEAVAAGLTEITQIAETIEEELEPLAGIENSITDEQSRKLLDRLAVLEAHLSKLTFSNELFSLNVSDFIDESFDNLQLNNLPESSGEIEEEFEIDEEMLEIFALEAEELLQNINAHLQLLEDAPNNREALLEIRRSAHTLKGSAGIMGLKKLSALAHRVEDLLDYLADNEIESNEQIFEILMTSTDCFETIASGESSEQLEKKIARLYQNFDEILAALRAKTVQEIQPVRANESFEIKDAQSPNLPANESRSTIRVSLDKLDELVKIVGNLLVSRSVFEQRLLEFNRQIEELNNSTDRLQQAAGKLEIDFGSNQFQVPNSRFQIPNSSANSSLIPHSSAFKSSSFEFDALEFDRYTEFNQTTRELGETAADAAAINGELDTLKDNLELLFDGQRRAIEEMQEKLLRLRMVRFGVLSARLQRTVRVTCEEEEKLAGLSIEGENVEFDTQILDSLVEPLLHLLRNAVAHGIEPSETRRLLGKEETGKIRLKVYSDGTHVNLTVADDGRGISTASLIEKAVEKNFISREKAERLSAEEAFELMFLPGLTTADRLSQVSGRGVGMNIVKTNIARQQGTISVKSTPQKGSTFTVRLPISLAVTRAFLVKAGREIFAFPLKLVRQVTEISAETLVKARRENALQIGATQYTPANLGELLGLPFSIKPNEQNSLLLIESAEHRFALTIDEIVKTEEIIIKPLGFPLQNCAEFLGAAILGDGRVIPVLDLMFLLKNKVRSPKSEVQSPNSENSPLSNLYSPLKVMIVDDSPSMRHVTAKLIENAGWKTIIAKDGLEALEILQTASELPDIILSDVEMPRMNGYELLAALKQQETLKKIPVIMITSRSGDKHRQKALELGVSEYLTKPFQDSVLVEVINVLTQPDN